MEPQTGIILAKAGGMFGAGVVLAALAFAAAIRSGTTQDWTDSVAMAIYGITAMTMFFLANKEFAAVTARGEKQDGPAEDHPRH